MRTALKAPDAGIKALRFQKPGPRSGAKASPRRDSHRASAPEDSGSHRTIACHPGNGEVQLSSVLGWKRRLDVACIIISLPLLMPLMVLIVFWIRLVSRGPALFRQERIGQDGRQFVLYKFRSMKLNCCTLRHDTYLRHLVKSDSPMIKLDLLSDSRLIPGGSLLRAAGLDELPQIFNVLRGEMSLVGPRPCLPQEYAFFSPRQRERFKALPGLTGSWQVNGKNQTTFSEMNAMDVHYVHSSSLLLDLRIMLRTPSALIRQMLQAFQQRHALHQVSGFREAARDSGSRFPTQRLS